VTTAGLGLVALFTVTNATAWLAANARGPAGPPTIWTPLGAIHSGRYANYSIFIASHDRIPYVAQNMGQSMMGACHLLLGVTSPLAALMAWIPVALAALALLVFGVLREHGLSQTWSAAGTYFVFACNVAFSLVAVFILDNGFPIAVIGYSDAITSLGTFVLIALWLRDALVLERAIPFRGVALPGLFALFWTWSPRRTSSWRSSHLMTPQQVARSSRRGMAPPWPRCRVLWGNPARRVPSGSSARRRARPPSRLASGCACGPT
jgi:hypothetical protein